MCGERGERGELWASFGRALGEFLGELWNVFGFGCFECFWIFFFGMCLEFLLECFWNVFEMFSNVSGMFGVLSGVLSGMLSGVFSGV